MKRPKKLLKPPTDWDGIVMILRRMKIRCGVCGFKGRYNATEWAHHYWRRCRS